MNQEFILGRLAALLGWQEEKAGSEFAWLRLMSRLKYDGYQDFLAGVRFIESLTDWLQQFQPKERDSAYEFVRSNLVFISPAEMRHLVELFYPEIVQPRLVSAVARQLGIAEHLVWADARAVRLYDVLLRKTLFVELSDGARIDVFRRANAGVISNEQVVTAPRINAAKWKEMLGDLRGSLGDTGARFSCVYLVDDFVGSGTTLLREDDGEWNGKVVRFREDLESEDVLDSHFETQWMLCVHHYIATHKAIERIQGLDAAIRRSKGPHHWFGRVEFTTGMPLPAEFPMSRESSPEFMRLVDAYYDDAIENRHMRKGGGGDARLGFGQCALPLVLEHNTPNNSIALLWAETAGANGRHAMRPLFRRRQRHS